jgi:hypothetical protein
MKRAFLNLRHAVPERWAAFSRGLERLGYTVVEGVTTKPGEHDILCSWNLVQEGRIAAQAFESRGRPVLVAENSSWGNGFQGGHWYTLCRGRHNTVGTFPVGGPERWDALNVELAPWRPGGETVIVPSRGIGPPGVAMPFRWAERALKAYGGRIRPHPGTGPCVPLQDDLARAGRVVTWGSGAAVLALMWGIPVVSEMPGWIAKCDPTDESRLTMFRKLAWSQFRISEIGSGYAFERLLMEITE